MFELKLHYKCLIIEEGLQKKLNCSWKIKFHLDYLLVFITEEGGRGNQRAFLDSGYDPPQVSYLPLGACEGPQGEQSIFFGVVCAHLLSCLFFHFS